MFLWNLIAEDTSIYCVWSSSWDQVQSTRDWAYGVAQGASGTVISGDWEGVEVIELDGLIS